MVYDGTLTSDHKSGVGMKVRGGAWLTMMRLQGMRSFRSAPSRRELSLIPSTVGMVAITNSVVFSSRKRSRTITTLSCHTTARQVSHHSPIQAASYLCSLQFEYDFFPSYKSLTSSTPIIVRPITLFGRQKLLRKL